MVALPSTWEGFGNPAVESAIRGSTARGRSLSGGRRARGVRVPVVRARRDGPAGVVARLTGPGSARDTTSRSRPATSRPPTSPIAWPRSCPSSDVGVPGPRGQLPCAAMNADVGTPSRHASSGRRAPEPDKRRLTAEARRRQLFDVALSLFADHGYAATHHGRHRRSGWGDQAPRVPALRLEACPLSRAHGRVLARDRRRHRTCDRGGRRPAPAGPDGIRGVLRADARRRAGVPAPLRS